MALDSSGNALVTGYTKSTDFAGASGSTHGGEDAFVAKVTQLRHADLGHLPRRKRRRRGLGHCGGRFRQRRGRRRNQFDQLHRRQQHRLRLRRRLRGQGHPAAGCSPGRRISAAAAQSRRRYLRQRRRPGRFRQHLRRRDHVRHEPPAGNNASNGDGDAFVTKLTSGGQPLWSCYLGGEGDEQGLGIAVDSSNNILVTGTTCSTELRRGRQCLRRRPRRRLRRQAHHRRHADSGRPISAAAATTRVGASPSTPPATPSSAA